MTIDEAIKEKTLCIEKYKQELKPGDFTSVNHNLNCKGMITMYEQEIKWLEELKKLRVSEFVIPPIEKRKIFDGGYNKAHEELESKYQELLYQAETNIRNKAIDDFYKNFINRIDWLREQNYDMYCAIGDDAHCILDDLKSRICS